MSKSKLHRQRVQRGESQDDLLRAFDDFFNIYNVTEKDKQELLKRLQEWAGNSHNRQRVQRGAIMPEYDRREHTVIILESLL